jgi:hypothetical protein
MLGVILLLIFWATFPEWPLISLLALCALVPAAKGWDYWLPDRAFSLAVWGALGFSLWVWVQ